MMKIMVVKKLWRGFKLASLGISPALLSLAVLLYAGPGFSAANRYGLMVGIDHYDPAYGPGDLGSCINDANGFRNCLLEDTSRWNASNITTLTDSSATKSAIKIQLSNLAGIAVSGELVVYFHSSHGGSNGGTNTYLCSYNADFDDWELAADLSNFADGVSVIIVIDACHSGGMFKENGEFIWPFARNVLANLEKIKRDKGISKGPNVGFMTACDYDETCWAGNPYSLFAGYVIEGFTNGDANGDGNVTFKELFDYALPRALAENRNQQAQSDNDALLSATIAAGEAGSVSYRILAGGNYNGDNSDDIAIFRPSSGLWSVRGITRCYFGGSSDIPVPGDYNGNGTTDIGIYRPSSGLWAIIGYNRVYFGSSSDTPVPADYTGNGICNMGIFRPSSGLWAVHEVTRAYFGSSGDTPVPANYSGTGGASFAIFRASSGLWASNGGMRVYFGSSDDIPVPIDTNGDGDYGIGLYRPSSGLWALYGNTRFYFGGSDDQPVPADFNQYSGDDPAIFRQSTGLWAIKGYTRCYFGASGDIPVTR